MFMFLIGLMVNNFKGATSRGFKCEIFILGVSVGVSVLVYSNLVPYLTRGKKSLFICVSCIKSGNKNSVTLLLFQCLCFLLV